MGQIAADDLRSVRELAVASYRRFLTSEETFNVESSAGFALEGVHSETAGDPDQPQRERPLVPRALGVAAGVGVLLGVVAWWVSRPDPAPAPAPVSITASIKANVPPATVLIDCDSPDAQALEGSIRVSGAVRLTYHWETPAGPRPSAELVFDRARQAPVPLVVPREPSPLLGTYALIVDAPSAHGASVQVACRDRKRAG